LLQLESYETPQARQLMTALVESATGIKIGSFGSRRVLIAASESGVWASELTVVASMLLAAGYKVEVATETGAAPHLLSVSCDPTFVDLPLGEHVVSAEEADLAKRFLDPATSEGKLLASDALVSLATIVRPPLYSSYRQDADGTLRELSAGIECLVQWTQKYDALVIAGGSGAVAGFAMNGGLHHLVLAFNRLRKPLVAECNGVFALVQAIDPATGNSVLHGRFATTHSKSHEYRRGGWGWARAMPDGTEAWTIPGADGNPIVDSEPMVRNALGPHGKFASPPATPYSVAVDDHLVTARTTPDGGPAALALLAILDGGGAFNGRRLMTHDRFFVP
jgi:putative intracellular protease/amidase